MYQTWYKITLLLYGDALFSHKIVFAVNMLLLNVSLQDIRAMQDLTRDLNTDQGFPAGTRPFFAHEVIDRNDGAVIVNEYYGMGKLFLYF